MTSRRGRAPPRTWIEATVQILGAALLLAALHRLALLADTPLWVLVLLLAAAAGVRLAAHTVAPGDLSGGRLHVLLALRAATATAVLYATGWGPALAVGYAFTAGDNVRLFGSRVVRWALLWSLLGLAGGQGAIALGWAPTLVPERLAHGLAVLMAFGVALVIRLFGTVGRELEERHAWNDTVLGAMSDLGEGLVVTERGRITYVNDAFARIVGHEPPELRALGSILELVVPERMDAVVERHRRSLAGEGGSARYETVLRRGDGGRATVEVAVQRLGRGRHLAIVRDIGEAVQSREALGRSEARFRELFESVEDILYVHDLEGNFRMVNEAAVRRTGYTREETLRMRVPDVVAPEHLERVVELAPRIISEDALPPFELEIVAKDGTRIPLELSTRLLRDEEGNPTAVLGVGRDVTMRKRAEGALRDAYERERDAVERLRALDELKSDFLATVSHELRTPLTAIKGFAATLRLRWEELGPSRRDFVDRIAVQSESLEELISQLLDFSRWEQGRLSVAPKPCDAGPAVRGVVEECGPLLGDHEVEVAAPDGITVWMDEMACRRILQNLLTNAAKFSEPGSPIRVSVEERDGEVVLSVADEGVGISPDETERIFERFYRVERGDRASTGGTGIGLAIVKAYAEALGGRAWAESEPGRGSTFRVALRAGPVSPGRDAG